MNNNRITEFKNYRIFLKRVQLLLEYTKIPNVSIFAGTIYLENLLKTETNVFLKYQIPAVSSVAKRTLSVRGVWVSIPGPVKSAQCRQRLATVATLLRSCVAQALSRGDGPRNSLHASA